jgi:hypothetical protein
LSARPAARWEVLPSERGRQREREQTTGQGATNPRHDLLEFWEHVRCCGTTYHATYHFNSHAAPAEAVCLYG